MLAVRILGCSGSYAEPGGACTGYLIESPEAKVWLDAGPGSLGNLQRWCSLAELDAIVLTHAHPDHWLEIPVVANALGWYEIRERVPVFSNAHMAGTAIDFLGADVVEQTFDWQIVTADSSVEVGDQRWVFDDTTHYVPTLAACVSAGGHTLAFSADTGPEFSFRRLSERVGHIDLALVESTFADRAGNEGTLHLAAAEAGSLAAEVGVGKLLLTHLSPGEDPGDHLARAASTFSGPIEAVTVGEAYDAADVRSRDSA